MFRRTKPEVSTAPEPSGGGATAYGSGKGRPTPTRKEAEAAARARAKAPLDPKGRSGRTGSTASGGRINGRTVREGLRNGDERFLRPRDQGPVRRFLRDFVDARLCMAELAIPGFLVSFVISTAGLPKVGSWLLNVLLLLIIVDSVFLRFRVARELKRRFPDQSTKGSTSYALVRSLQVRLLRLPKPQVRLGQALPAQYR